MEYSNEIKNSPRMLGKNPGFTLAAIGALALGIGANAAIFSAMKTVLLKPLTYSGADRLMKFLSASTGIASDLHNVLQVHSLQGQSKLFKKVVIAASFCTSAVSEIAETGHGPLGQGSFIAESQPGGSPLYPDLPFEKLQKAVPSLDGTQPATNQDSLQSILERMAGTIADFAPRLPNLISRENVSREEDTARTAPERILSLTRSGTGPLNQTTITGRTGSGMEYQYLILCHRAPNGATALEEVRTDLKGHRLTEMKNAPALGSGFAYQWLLFGSANQAEFRFSLVGQQRLEDRETYVIAFAQIPSQVKFPAVFQSGGKKVPYFYQGIIWVDQATSNIAALRSDIQTRLPESRLERLTTELRFRSVEIRELNQSFWLPSEVHILIEQGGLVIHEDHSYSNYHLFHSTARIVP